MTKRQMPDLSALLATTAAPMADATEAPPRPAPARPAANDADALPAAKPKAARVRTEPSRQVEDEAATANLENLNFKVPKSFRKRFRDCAYRADLKHNELLFAALEAWEARNKN